MISRLGIGDVFLHEGDSAVIDRINDCAARCAYLSMATRIVKPRFGEPKKINTPKDCFRISAESEIKIIARLGVNWREKDFTQIPGFKGQPIKQIMKQKLELENIIGWEGLERIVVAIDGEAARVATINGIPMCVPSELNPFFLMTKPAWNHEQWNNFLAMHADIATDLTKPISLEEKQNMSTETKPIKKPRGGLAADNAALKTSKSRATTVKTAKVNTPKATKEPKAKKEKSASSSGRMKIMGNSAYKIAVTLGKKGVTLENVKAIIKAQGSDLSEGTISQNYYLGKSGKGNMADLTGDQIKELIASAPLQTEAK